MRNGLSSFYEDPEFKESLAKYEGMVASHTPTYFDADELVDIAQYYATKERYKEADRAIEFALHLHPNDTDALVFRARSLAMMGKRDEAHKVAERIEDKTDREAMFLQAELLIDEDRMDEAERILSKVADDEDYDIDTLLDILEIYTDFNREYYANLWYTWIVNEFDDEEEEAHRENQRYRDVLCDYFIAFDTPAAAIPLLQKTLDQFPYSVQHWVELGKCYVKTEDTEKAHEAFDFALAIDDKNSEAWAMKGLLYCDDRCYAEARDAYLHLAEVTTHKAPAYLLVAKTCFEMSDFETAKKYLNMLLDDKSLKLSNYELAELYGNLALCHAFTDHSQKGHEYIERAQKLNDTDPKVMLTSGRFYLAEAHRAGITEGEKSLHMNMARHTFEYGLNFVTIEERPEALFNIASTYFDFREYAHAVPYYLQVGEEFPEHIYTTYVYLLYSYFYLNNLDSFMHYLAKIKKETPQLYNELGNANAWMQDQQFNMLMIKMKEKIASGEIELYKYL